MTGSLNIKNSITADAVFALTLIRVGTTIYASAVAEKISKGEYKRGIVICYTGIGTSIVANKLPRVRAALVTSEDIAELTRKHNDSNVLALAAGIKTKAPMAIINKPIDIPDLYPILFKTLDAGIAITTKEMYDAEATR